ncbi:MAG TPA: TlpA disulfide reductase family protein [Acidimicrobiia bacterium]
MVGVGLLAAWIVGSAPTVATIGEQAPDFTVELIEGGTFTLSEVDKPVLLNFWASWCVPCRTEIPDISAFADANPQIQVIGIAVEDVESAAREFAAEIGASYPLALGTTEVEDSYPRLGLPVTYVLDENGVVTDIFNGIVNQEVLGELFSQ